MSSRNAHDAAKLKEWEGVRDGAIGRILEQVWPKARDNALSRALRPWALGRRTKEDPSSLRRALSIGAYETAERLARDLLATGPGSLPEDSLTALVETLIVIGEGGEAYRVAREHVAKLAASDRGAATLELLGLTSTETWLPSGRPNCLQLCRAIEREQLNVFDLAARLAPLGWRASQNSDLDLLFFNAARRKEPAVALRFLRRYLRAHRVPSNLQLANPQTLALPDFEWGPLPRQRGPLVSVLVAARNAERTVVPAIDSLLNQSYQALEVLIADDASEDRTCEVVKARYGADPRVRLFASKENQGAYNTKNALIPLARGELIAFHDADDIALPFRVALQVAQLRRKATVACVGNGVRVRAAGTFVFFKDQRATRLSPISLMVRREVLESAGRFQTARVGADGELHARLLHRYGERRVVRLRAPLTFSSWGDDSVTRAVGTESFEDGYRSPSRRAYSELVARRYILQEPISAARFQARLQETGNLVEPRPLHELI